MLACVCSSSLSPLRARSRSDTSSGCCSRLLAACMARDSDRALSASPCQSTLNMEMAHSAAADVSHKPVTSLARMYVLCMCTCDLPAGPTLEHQVCTHDRCTHDRCTHGRSTHDRCTHNGCTHRCRGAPESTYHSLPQTTCNTCADCNPQLVDWMMMMPQQSAASRALSAHKLRVTRKTQTLANTTQLSAGCLQ